MTLNRIRVTSLSTATLAVAMAATGSLAFAAPAHASDFRDTYAAAAERTIVSSDIPRVLGTYVSTPYMSLQEAQEPLFICSSATDINGITAPGGEYVFITSFKRKSSRSGINNVISYVTQYAKATDAIAAFQQVKKKISKCVSLGAQSGTDPDSGDAYSSSYQTSVGRVPLVSVVGVDSLFVNTNRLSDDGSGPKENGSYSVFSLINDAIITISVDTGSSGYLSTAQKQAVNKVAFAATGRWVG